MQYATQVETYLAPVLLITGIITLSAGMGLLMPRNTLAMLFGIDASDAATLLLGRHWSLLIGLVGGLLIYAAYHPEIRVPVMVVGTIEKLVLAGLVIAGPLRKRPPTLVAVGADSIMALLYIVFLIR
ncbi:MAG TPA: hypothetical protein VHS56_14020 [Candidatus Cybelea sp.]|jgi:hypothetical protein|nr:hypothetical protein [Candidatus Cybelea sp.]